MRKKKQKDCKTQQFTQKCPSEQLTHQQLMFPQSSDEQNMCIGCITQQEESYLDHLFENTKEAFLVDGLIQPAVPTKTHEIQFSNYRKFSYNKQEETIQNIQKYICALLNRKLGYLFIGIQRDKSPTIKSSRHHIKGIKIQEEQKKEFVAAVKRKIQTFLMPNEQIKSLLADSEQFDKAFQIRFLPVKYMNEAQPSNNLYVIRIKVNTTKVISHKTLFYLNVRKLGGQGSEAVCSYVFEDGDIRQIAAGDMSSQIEKMFRTKKQDIDRKVANLYNHSPNIKCKQMEEIKVQREQKGKEVEKHEGKKKIVSEEKRYNYESLIVVPKHKINSFQSIIEGLKNKKIRFYLEEVKIHEYSVSSRLVFYLSHQKNYEAMNRYFKKEQQQMGFSQIIIFNVRRNLVLLSMQDQPKVLDSLISFTSQFGANFLSGLKRSYNPDVMEEIFYCFFQFETKMQAIYAFVSMQERNIRANFVNEGKTEGTNWKVC